MEARASGDGPTYVIIKAQQTRSGLVGSNWRFIAVDREARIVAASYAFESGGHAMRDSRQARIALESLIAILQRGGWIMELAPGQQANAPWYAYGFRSEGSRPLTSSPPSFTTFDRSSPPKREGMSIQGMWAITLLVVIVLFAICVVLAFTAQLEIRPAT